MPNIKEIANTIKGLEDMHHTISLAKKEKVGVGAIIYLEGTGHWLNVDASLFCIKNALQVLEKQLKLM